MRLWVKTNALLWLVAVTLIATSLALLIDEQQILMPNLSGGPILAPMPAQIFLTLAPVMFLALIFDRGLEVPIILSRRKLSGLNLSLVAATLLTATCVLALESLWQNVEWILLQNLFLFAGIEVLFTRWLPAKLAAIAPTAWVLVCALYGHDFQAGGLQIWAFTLEPQPTQAGWTTSALTLGIGCLAYLTNSRQSKFRLFTINQ